MRPIEGSPFGPDKIAHFLFCPAVTFALAWWRPDLALVWWLVSLIVGLVWEASNQWFVFTGKAGISILDAVAFVLGWGVAGLELYFLEVSRWTGVNC